MKRRRPKKRISIELRIFYFFAVVIIIITAGLKYTDARVMPSVTKAIEMHSDAKATRAIDNAAKHVIADSEITSSDLYVKALQDDGKITSLTANTVLINSICADVATAVTDELFGMRDDTINLPVGIISGIDFLSNTGPEVFKVSVRPIGDCRVDYKTSFKSEGINQVNYQIWLEIEARVSAINPLVTQNFIVKRNIPIVNTYINGDVPGTMLYPILK